MGLLFNKNLNTLFIGASEVSMIYMGSTLIWPVGLPVGTTFDFEYTGTVQSVELPKGKYKLQCWGAQGGSNGGTGSRGGYSEGVLTLNSKTNLYVFVGGCGSTSGNGGWNGGGSSTGHSSYTSGNEYGESSMASGGGATDISTVTSDMSYSSGRTNRSSASLLARCIVAGGGAGGSSYYQEITDTYSEWVDAGSYSGLYWWWSGSDGKGKLATHINISVEINAAYRVYVSHASSELENAFLYISTPFGDVNEGGSFVATSSSGEFAVRYNLDYPYLPSESASETTFYIEKYETYSTTDSYSDSSSQFQQGGGTSGKGQYPGTQTSAGSGGGFGYGANQETTNYMYCSGGGGGGWYGGGSARADSSTEYINYSGGGSGFVNTSANASSRPSGYTGLQLDSGTTTAGNTSHPSKNGGMETGHSGNGFARIIAVDEDGNYPIPEPTYSINWEVRYGTWNDSSSSSAADGLSWTCTSPGSGGSTALRCTFSGISSITFNCVYNGESNYDYLTVGSLDTSCSRTSYGISLKGTSGTAKDITFTCDTGEHYVEFCYSKDGSGNTSPDNATVYIKAYS